MKKYSITGWNYSENDPRYSSTENLSIFDLKNRIARDIRDIHENCDNHDSYDYGKEMDLKSEYYEYLETLLPEHVNIQEVIYKN